MKLDPIHHQQFFAVDLDGLREGVLLEQHAVAGLVGFDSHTVYQHGT